MNHQRIPASGDLLTISQAADVLGVSIETLRRWDKAGKLHATRADGKNRFFNRQEVEALKTLNPLSISEAAEALGISVSTLRRYEKKGIITPKRSETKQRVYTEETLRAFDRMKSAGSAPLVSSAPIRLTAKPVLHRSIPDYREAPTRRLPTWSQLGMAAAFVLVVIGAVAARGQTLSIPETSILGVTTATPSGFFQTITNVFRGVTSLVARVPVMPFFQPKLPDISEFFTKDAAGNIIPTRPLIIPSSDFLKLQDIVPVAPPSGNLAILTDAGLLPGLRITSINITAGAISGGTGGAITDGSITSADIKDATIATADIADAAITGAKLASGIGGTPNDGSVTNAKLADDAVTSSKIANDTITTTDLSGTLTFGSGELVDLSGITQSSTSKQGLILPNASSASPSSPSSGEGYIAWDTSGNQIIVYNGSSWGTVSGGGSGDITGVTAGNGLSGGGDSGAVSLAVALTTSGTTGSDSSNSGLEVGSGGLTLLKGCIDGQLLEYTDSGGWACADDNTSAGAGVSTIQEGDTTKDGSATTIDFLAADFAVTSDPAGEANVAIDYTNSKIVRSDQNESITGAWTFNTDTTFTLAEAEDLILNLSVSGTNAGQAQTVTLTNSSASGNQYGIYVDNAASTGTTEALLVLDNSDLDTAVTAAIQIVNAGGGFTNVIDNAGTGISGTELNLLDSGVALSELTDSGTLTATTVDINGGAVDGVTIGANAAGAGTFTVLSSTGNTTIGNANSDTLTINAGTSGTGITLADTSFANCSALETVSGVLTCGSDDTGAGGGIATIEENDVSQVASATVIDFLGTDFIVGAVGTEGNISIDYTNSKIVRSDQAETITGGWTFGTNATTFTTAITSNGGLTTGAGTGLTLASGNNGAGAAGNISVDVGTSTAGNGSILIGTAARTQTITIGNSTGGTITVGQSSGSDLVLNDAQWSVTGAGAASFASVTEGGTGLSAKYAPINANFVTVTANGTLTGETGIDALTTAISTTSTLNVDGATTLAGVTLDANSDLTFTSGTGSLVLTNSVSNASDQVIDLAPAFAGGVTDTLTYTVIDVAAFSPTNAAGTDTVNAMEIGALTQGADDARLTATAIKIGSGWDTGISVAAGGITITAGALAVNSDSITSDGTLTIDANARVSIATGDFFSTSVAGVTGAAAGDIWYDSNAGKYKINEGGSTKVLCNTTDLGCGTGGGGGIATVEANNVDVVTTAVSLDFLGADFDVALDTAEGSNEADVSIDYTNSGITRKAQAETITGGWTFTPATTTDITFNGDADSNIQFTGTLASDATSVNSVDISTVINAVAGAAVVYGVNIAQADNTTNAAVVDAILRVQNANAADTTADGLLIEQTGAGTLTAALEIKESAGTITDGILITGTFANILNSASIDITGAGAITGATGVSTTTVTASDAIAANGGITFDSGGDTVGAFTAAGTILMGTNIIENIGNTGTDFIATTGALTLAGDLTLSNNTLVCTGCIDVTDMAANAVDDSELVDALTYTGALTLTPGTTLDVTVNMDADSTFALVFSSGTTATNGVTYSVTNSASSGTVAVVGQDITLVGTANAAGTNTITGIKFENVTAQTNNTFNGLTFGTGFTNFLTSGTINISAAGAITGATGVSTTTVTASDAIAANGGITFDASTDTIGAHTAAGTYNMNANIITNIGAANSSFTTSGALELVLDAAAANGALNVDNGAQTSSIFVAEDNGGAVFTIADGGDITWAATTPAITINDNEVLTIADAATADTFTINTSGSLFSFSDGTNSFTFDVDTGPVYAENARPTKKVTLTPEYPGGSIMADGADNTGTMTSDNTNAGATKYRNFYKWANTQGTAQDYDIWVSIPIPNDFSAMAATPTLSIDTYTSDLTNGTVLVTVYDSQSTPVADCTDALFTPTGAINTWETKTQTTCLDTGTYTAGGVMTIKLHLTAAATTGVTQVSTITFDYRAKF